MAQVTIDLQSNIADKLNYLIQLFGSKDLLFDKFVDYHINKLKKEIVKIQIDLNEFEKKYEMSTLNFYGKFEKGELGDSKDFIIWSGIYELQLDSKQRLNKLI